MRKVLRIRDKRGHKIALRCRDRCETALGIDLETALDIDLAIALETALDIALVRKPRATFARSRSHLRVHVRERTQPLAARI